ncbi:unnamed protein product, partial [Heterosigma akashiwo]
MLYTKTASKELSGVEGTYEFQLHPGLHWLVHMNKGSGQAVKLTDKDTPSPAVGVTVECESGVFAAIVSGRTTTQQAFSERKLRILGDMALAMKVEYMLDMKNT